MTLTTEAAAAKKDKKSHLEKGDNIKRTNCKILKNFNRKNLAKWKNAWKKLEK